MVLLDALHPSPWQHWVFEGVVNHHGLRRWWPELLTELLNDVKRGLGRRPPGHPWVSIKAEVAPCGPKSRVSMAFGSMVADFNGHGLEHQPLPLVIQVSESRRQMHFQSLLVRNAFEVHPFPKSITLTLFFCSSQQKTTSALNCYLEHKRVFFFFFLQPN